jgi:hypothetical protein
LFRVCLNVAPVVIPARVWRARNPDLPWHYSDARDYRLALRHERRGLAAARKPMKLHHLSSRRVFVVRTDTGFLARGSHTRGNDKPGVPGLRAEASYEM